MTLLCVPLVGRTVEEMIADAAAAAATGGDMVEIRLDFIQGFRPREHLPPLFRSCPLPALVTYRFVRHPSPSHSPSWHPAMASAVGFGSFHFMDSAATIGYPERACGYSKDKDGNGYRLPVCPRVKSW
jgi:hypothetical protein